MEKIIDDRWIGIEEAANYLGVNKDTIRNWIKKDTGIPAHRIGKLWKFKKWLGFSKMEILTPDELVERINRE